MRCNMIKMQRAGVPVPKHEVHQAAKCGFIGDLAIFETREHNLNRITKLAKLTRFIGERRKIELLYDPHILWLSEEKLRWTGFEQALTNAIEHAPERHSPESTLNAMEFT